MNKETSKSEEKKAAEKKSAQASFWASVLLPLSLVVVVG
jgi:hypothetical protein